ncbi:MAG: response regulator [Phycisphaerae bacterium]|nr:response regulator [Phycisphaerae bacterium]
MTYKQKTILIIDDDKMIREILKHALSRNGYCILTAEEGTSGIEMATEENITAIILDWMMPGMDGMEVLKQLKDNKITANIPVIMLTSKDASAEIGQAVSEGAVNYIVKPFNPAEACQLIETTLNESQHTEKEAKFTLRRLFSSKTSSNRECKH